MKVLYVTSNGGIHDYRFLKKLAEEHKVLLLHYAADKLIHEIKELKGLEIISVKPFKKSFPLLSHVLHFRRVVKNFSPDVIHTGYVWQVGILASFWNFHPHLSMPWGSDILIEPDKSSFIKKIVRRVMKQCDHVQCDAEEVKKKIISDYGLPENKITVFPWGIDLGLFRKSDKLECRKNLNLAHDKFIIIYNRYLEPVYGVQFMLEGFRQFAESKDDVHLLMLSVGKLKNGVIDFIAENKLERKITLIGGVSNRELPQYLNASDVYISTSLSDGTSLSLLEAMACGCGMVVSDVPAILEWINTDNGIVVPRGASVEVADALEKYYSNRTLIGQHGNKNIDITKERADWDKNYQKLNEIYKKITGG